MYNYEFVVWLEGYLDLCPEDALTLPKLRIIRNHLNLVKAADPEGLGPLNTELYEIISDAIAHYDSSGQVHPVKPLLREKLDAFLVRAFPEGVFETAQ